MKEQHHYEVTIDWTGNTGAGTSAYADYERSHTISANGKPTIYASADTPFRGDATKFNPEDFLLASLSSCHMLWYLHLCADAGIIVVDYSDKAHGSMVTPPGARGHFSEVVLHPTVTINDANMIERANALHDMAREKCFIANSVNFPVRHEPVCRVSEPES